MISTVGQVCMFPTTAMKHLNLQFLPDRLTRNQIKCQDLFFVCPGISSEKGAAHGSTPGLVSFMAMLKLAKAQRGRKPITTSQTCNWEMGLWGELCMRSIIVFGQLPVIDLLERLPSTPLGQVE